MKINDTLTVPMSADLKKKVIEEAKKKSLTASAYVRLVLLEKFGENENV